ncbi:MAG: TIGR02147 family protein [Deltaproteobacteria bacterium]|nr:TIGR02147 family protein [Deltaproteobacteria bacterium]
MEKPDLFEYADYRDYLRDIYQYLKISSKGTFSFRAFAKKAQMGSPNYLKLVMDGERELSAKTIQKFGRALSLNKNELSFFEALVFFCKSHNESEKEFYYNKLKRFKKFKLAQNITLEQHGYFSKWYIPVIREMVLLKGFKPDAQWIAKHLDPPISPKEAETALDTLVSLGFLTKNAHGKFEQQELTLATSTEEQSVPLWNFHREMIVRAHQALYKPNIERNISGMTAAVSLEQFEEVKKMINQFFVQINDYLEENKSTAELICQINFQQFKLTR